MAGVSRTVEAAGDSGPSDRASEGSSRPRLQRRVGEVPPRAPPTTAVGRGRIGGVQNLCHPLSTQGKLVKEIVRSVRQPAPKEPKLAIMFLVSPASRGPFQPSC